MIRRRYRYDPESGEMVEVTAEPPRQADVRLSGLWGDRHYDGLRTTDGVDISSRKKHREYMKRTGLTTADDFKQSWDNARREREHYMKNGGTVRKSDIAEAIRQIERR